MIAIPCAFRAAITSNSFSVSREVSEVVGSSMTMMRALVDERARDLDHLSLAERQR